MEVEVREFIWDGEEYPAAGKIEKNRASFTDETSHRWVREGFNLSQWEKV